MSNFRAEQQARAKIVFEASLAQMAKEYLEDRAEDTSEKWQIKDRVVDALAWTGKHELALAMKECQIGNRCGSLWCPDCRQSCVQNYHSSVAEECWARGFKNEDLYYITAHMGVTNVDADEVKRLLEKDEKFWRRARHRSDGLWVSAVYEFELVSVKGIMRSALDGSVIKKNQLSQMMESYDGVLGENIVYVHWHGVANKMASEWIKDSDYIVGEVRPFRTNESGVYQIRLHSDKSFEENIKKLCSYPFKNPTRFKHSFIGNDSNSGERMTNGELSSIVSLYQDVQGRQKRSLFRSIC